MAERWAIVLGKLIVAMGFFSCLFDVCGKEESVWFVLSDMEEGGKRFL